MSRKRIVQLAAVLGLAAGFLSPALPASAQTYCWTVIRDTAVYTSSSGSDVAGPAYAGDTFESTAVQGLRWQGVDDNTGTFGWIYDGDLTGGFPCG